MSHWSLARISYSLSGVLDRTLMWTKGNLQFLPVLALLLQDSELCWVRFRRSVKLLL